MDDTSQATLQFFSVVHVLFRSRPSWFQVDDGTEMALVALLDNMQWTMDRGVCPSLLIPQDFSAATIDHGILLDCLSELAGIV